MFERMPWDELRDGGDDGTEAELAELEAEERQMLGWIDALAEQQPDPFADLPLPGLAKAYCRHPQYDFALTAETRHAVCCTCGHEWLVVLGDGDTDYLPANLPGVALR